MRRTFDFTEEIINPTARGEIHKITHRVIPEAAKYNKVRKEAIQGWSLDPISGTTSRLGPEQNPIATKEFPFGRNAGNFPEFGQIPKLLEVLVYERLFGRRGEESNSSRELSIPSTVPQEASRFVNLYITTPQVQASPTSVYSGKHVNGSN